MSTTALLQPALFLAPALLLWALLALGRYPGEAVVTRLARRRPPRAHREARAPSKRAHPKGRPRLRNLLACSLAGRGPPPAVHVR